MSAATWILGAWLLVAQGEVDFVGPPEPAPESEPSPVVAAALELAGPPEDEAGPPAPPETAADASAAGSDVQLSAPAAATADAPTDGPPPPAAPDQIVAASPPGFMEMADAPAVEESAAGTEVDPAAAFTLRRSGLYHWGLGLELPMLGLLTGVGSRSSVGVGVTWGGALSWELTPEILLRLGATYGETSGAESPIRYVQGSRERRADQPAQWVGAEVLAGGAYQFREPGRVWSLYAGGEVGATFSGYYFDLDDEHQFLRAIDAGNAIDQCGSPNCLSTSNDGLGFAFTAVARGGLRWDFFPWLQGLGDLSIQYIGSGNEGLSNTVAARDVRVSPETTLLFRLTVGARLVL